jgi:biopolymer transport protein ExbD/biopolymer transport protein TolR
MGMAAGGASKKGQVTPSMNVTPLVDVVLVLLIIFMVVTPLLAKQFWLNLPKKDDSAEAPPPDTENKNVVVSVDKSGVIKINADVVPKEELRDRLRRIMAARSEKVIYFDADDQAPYQSAVEAMDIARQGGASTIAIMTDKIVR